MLFAFFWTSFVFLPTVDEITYMVTEEYIYFIFTFFIAVHVGEPVFSTGYFTMRRIETLRLFMQFFS